jgi:hypothetical protein
VNQQYKISEKISSAFSMGTSKVGPRKRPSTLFHTPGGVSHKERRALSITRPPCSLQSLVEREPCVSGGRGWLAQAKELEEKHHISATVGNALSSGMSSLTAALKGSGSKEKLPSVPTTQR